MNIMKYEYIFSSVIICISNHLGNSKFLYVKFFFRSPEASRYRGSTAYNNIMLYCLYLHDGLCRTTRGGNAEDVLASVAGLLGIKIYNIITMKTKIFIVTASSVTTTTVAYVVIYYYYNYYYET